MAARFLDIANLRLEARLALIYLANEGWGFESAVGRYWGERYDDDEEEEEEEEDGGSGSGSENESSDENDVSYPLPSPPPKAYPTPSQLTAPPQTAPHNTPLPPPRRKPHNLPLPSPKIPPRPLENHHRAHQPPRQIPHRTHLPAPRRLVFQRLDPRPQPLAPADAAPAARPRARREDQAP